VDKDGVKTGFKYNTEGLRYASTTGANTVQYQYDNSGRVITEGDAAGNITANYVWAADRLLVKKDVASGNEYYYLYNGHGDVTQIVDIAGNVVNSYEYDAWGNVTSQVEGISNSFKYAGEILDSETGLYYLRARYYDAVAGRFLGEDSFEGKVTDPLSLNVYTYVLNNPLRYIDPTGHREQGETISLNPATYNRDVKTLQSTLNSLGFKDNNGDSLKADGFFGNNTLQAVNSFKEFKNLGNNGEYSGKVGDQTWEMLGLTNHSNGTSQKGLNFAIAGGIRFEAALSYVSDSRGDWDLQLTAGFGGGTPAVGPGVCWGSTNATSIDELTGKGGGGGSSFLIGGDYLSGSTYSGKQFGIGTKTVLPEFHATVTQTWSVRSIVRNISNFIGVK
jgi:RHS repeat-associated protein